MSARQQLLESLGSTQTATEPRAVAPRQFIKDFEVVSEHYGLKHIGEYLLAKEAARSDLENAVSTYAALAAEIAKDRT